MCAPFLERFKTVVIIWWQWYTIPYYDQARIPVCQGILQTYCVQLYFTVLSPQTLSGITICVASCISKFVLYYEKQSSVHKEEKKGCLQLHLLLVYRIKGV